MSLPIRSIFVLPIDPSSPTTVDGTPFDVADLWKSAPTGKRPAKVGVSRLFYGDPTAALVSLGESFNQLAGDARRESVRKAVGSACMAVKGLGDEQMKVVIDASADAHAAAVAAHLARYKFSLKTDPPSTFRAKSTEDLDQHIALGPIAPCEAWNVGVVYAQGQNLARTLQEMPANLMTPSAFCERAKVEFAGIQNVTISERDEAWAEKNGMHAFLSVTKGTDEPARILEIHYNGATRDEQPVVFVGKGVTFDAGGINIKPGANMKAMRSDMGGAAVVLAATLAIAQLKLPVNLVTICPLTENMPGPKANKPGDVVYAMNGKSVDIDNTDCEGRLILADSMYYALTMFKPHTIIDVATLTYGVQVALGGVFSGVYADSDELWQELHVAGEKEYDRFWRLPLDDDYKPIISGASTNADVMNYGGPIAGSITAAMFLKVFVDSVSNDSSSTARWAHIDIAGVFETSRASAYQEVGMTGRPVRSLIRWMEAYVAQKAKA